MGDLTKTTEYRSYIKNHDLFVYPPEVMEQIKAHNPTYTQVTTPDIWQRTFKRAQKKGAKPFSVNTRRHKNLALLDISQTSGKQVPFIAFTLKDGFHWIGEYDITLDELLAGDISPQRGRHREKAKEFLETLLENGEVSSEEVYAQAEATGISRRTLERAKSELGIRSVQFADGWVWRLYE